MARYDNSYSRFIAWMKVVLPLAALGVLSTLFLLARTVDPSRAISSSGVDVEGMAREMRIGSPDYAGVTKDGTAISLRAESARPDLERKGLMTAHVVRGVLETVAGRRYEISALDALVDPGAAEIVLEGDVIVQSTSGYEIRTERMDASVDETRLESRGAVIAKGPPGTLRAGGMVLRATTGGDRGHVLVFNGGVKLIYDPKAKD
ncbi:MAG: LPS export ABC transporter periplasmic protein LptC [Rhodobacteraceae bacterium]|jgi:lipopolysaccharide export system protein LptC|nr:LPS export ABC transporter periplasmic protein LptC [Paracoccaceae bacterium]